MITTIETMPATAAAGHRNADDVAARLFAENQHLATWAARAFAGYARRDPIYSPDDLRQIARVGLMQAARAYDPTNGASFATFAHTCCLREIQGATRRLKTSGRERRRVSLFDHEGELAHDPAAPAVDLADEIDRAALLRRLRRAIRNGPLTARERQAVILRHLDGMKLEAAGAVMGITDEGVRQCAERGLRKLREHLAGNRTPAN